MSSRTLALPHRFPFRFLEPEGEDGVAFRVTAGGRLPGADELAGPFGLPLTLAVEGLAQAALTAQGLAADRPGSLGSLAAIDGARLLAELRPGDVLIARVRTLGRFGPAIKVACTFLRDGEPVVEAQLLLHMDTF